MRVRGIGCAVFPLPHMKPGSFVMDAESICSVPGMSTQDFWEAALLDFPAGVAPYCAM